MNRVIGTKMKRLANTAAALLGLLVLGALAVALALTFSGLRKGQRLHRHLSNRRLRRRHILRQSQHR